MSIELNQLIIFLEVNKSDIVENLSQEDLIKVARVVEKEAESLESLGQNDEISKIDVWDQVRREILDFPAILILEGERHKWIDSSDEDVGQKIPVYEVVPRLKKFASNIKKEINNKSHLDGLNEEKQEDKFNL